MIVEDAISFLKGIQIQANGKTHCILYGKEKATIRGGGCSE
jgi:hypothetical protein